ncbi:zinc finger and BTB domain-containing protein 6-like isoform X2 [Tachypleus tridentatus]|uniref:zinc finger and BTB domain-containing protein 6-like isoform X2 n=1 Tax=Tachypleus tridentatus TaxID=6853 RepID=UPI003FCF6567
MVYCSLGRWHVATRNHGSMRKYAWKTMTVNTDGGIRYQCPDCYKLFISNKTLQHHHFFQHQHHKAFKCLGCGKDFTRKSNLVRHATVTTCGTSQNLDVLLQDN